MRQRKLDYKVNKSTQKAVPNRKKASPISQSNYTGLIVKIVLLIALLIAGYNFFKGGCSNNSISENKNIANPPSNNQYNHFLLFNLDKQETGKLLSVIMVSYSTNGTKIILTYYPVEATLLQTNTLLTDYQINGLSGVINQFNSFFQYEFQYITIYSSIYPYLASRLKNIIIYLDKDSRSKSILNREILDNYKPNENLYLIQGENIFKYLYDVNLNDTMEAFYILRDRMLFTLKSFLSTGENLHNLLKNNQNIKELFGERTLDSKIIDQLISKLKIIKSKNILTYPAEFQLFDGRFRMRASKDNYDAFLKSPGAAFIGGAKLKIYIYDQSSRGDSVEFSRSNLKKFLVQKMGLGIEGYFIRKQVVTEESYLINSSHKIEMANYIQRSLNINHLYNSGLEKSNLYDLLLVMGKDFYIVK